MTLRVGLDVLALGAGALAGCGTQGPASTTSSAATTSAGTTSGTPSSTGTAACETTEPEAITELVGFISPSDNVGCMLDPTYVRCDISEHDWSPPPRPADCEFDCGQGINMSAGERPAFNCAGDTVMGAGAPLAYGKSITKGNLTCASAKVGITCRDSATGHGFTTAR
ncbi:MULTISPECIES: DUF6636 domain-containing protein [unclassified Mycobacterium]|uniref:DUF6636 domain-containing protein n=1 Tax=unclassified Mycobacterium TaxID=2642494 RepID=UPI0029C71A40|nr:MULTISPECIES: DUF6636 domain-containing protein [unclassified Mycobacterium]